MNAIERAVIDNPYLSHSAIGRLVGRSRERVRQVRGAMGLKQKERAFRECTYCKELCPAASFVSMRGNQCADCRSKSARRYVRQRKQEPGYKAALDRKRKRRATDPEYREKQRATWRRYYHREMQDPVKRAAFNKRHSDYYHARVAARRAALEESNE